MKIGKEPVATIWETLTADILKASKHLQFSKKILPHNCKRF